MRSCTISHRPNTDAFNDDVPSIIALVELSEGVTVMSNLPSVASAEVEIGMAVELVWEQRESQAIYQIQPAQRAFDRPGTSQPV